MPNEFIIDKSIFVRKTYLKTHVIKILQENTTINNLFKQKISIKKIIQTS